MTGNALRLAANSLAQQSGLGDIFIGATLFAGVSALPELSTTIAAVRRGSHVMAVGNNFGSTMLMVSHEDEADSVYRTGPILSEADNGISFAVAAGAVVTAIYLIGLIEQTPQRAFWRGRHRLTGVARGLPRERRCPLPHQVRRLGRESP